MVFPIPSHLPRATNQQNKSTQILAKIGEISVSEFSASLTASWIDELDEAIRETKNQIKNRIFSDLPDFERQLASSRSVQTRLLDLANNVDQLLDSVSNSETGPRQSLVKQLEEHSLLAQNTLDTQVKYRSLSHLIDCMTSFDLLSDVFDRGELTTALKLYEDLQILIDNSPEPLPEAAVFLDLKQRVRVIRSSVEEQLNDAYQRSIRISPSSFIICPAVQVLQSQTMIDLPDILTSLPSSALSEHLSNTRRDLVHYFFEEPLKTPHSVDIIPDTDENGTPAVTYSLSPSSLEDPFYIPPLEHLSSLLNFLSEYLFSALPASEQITFPQTLSSPLTKAILQNLLVPSIPSSIKSLHVYLALLSDAIKFERNSITAVLNESHEPEISTWAENIHKHYSHKRRTELLESARAIVLSPASTAKDRFSYVEVADGDQVVPEDSTMQLGENDGAEWDFDEDVIAEVSTQEKTNLTSKTKAESGETAQEEVNDPSDAWGWDDDEQTIEEDAQVVVLADKHANGKNSTDEIDQPVWDAWDDVDPEPLPPPPVTQPKQAKRLEKFNKKHKAGKASNANPESPTSLIEHDADSMLTSPITPATASTFPNNFSSEIQPPPSVPSQNPPQPLVKQQKEIFQITGCARDILELVYNVLSEGEEMVHSTVFNEFFFEFAPSSSASSNIATSSGAVIKSTAVAILDSYRTLYPMFYSEQLDKSLARSIIFANDCEFIHQEVMKRVAAGNLEAELNQNLRNAAEEFLYLVEEWTQTTMQRAQERFRASLSRANGFVDTSDQSNFDEYEAAVTDVLQDIIALGRDWKKILPISKYYWAIGMVVETALTNLIEAILALHDITEVESHRLSELCKMLHTLEKLFINAMDSSFVTVAYVPSWLKFSYLSELLEGSMADILYLFDEGALVDFEIKELVGLVRALFADTPIRANAIARLSKGHPTSR